MSILEFLGLARSRVDGPQVDAETETVRKIVTELDQLEPERARFVAAFAYLLGRVAHADRDISDEETRAMERLVAERGELPPQMALIVVQMAKTQNVLFGATENFLVTREFDRLASREQKYALLDCLFAVSAADDSISNTENAEIRQIASQIHVEHEQFVEIRSRYRDRLEVLRDLPRGDG